MTNDTGTGIVHTAPSHGLDDFNICVYHQVISMPGMSQVPEKAGLPQVSLPPTVPRYPLKEDVDANGCYYATAWTPRLQGKSVLKEGTMEVVCVRCRFEIDCDADRIEQVLPSPANHTSLSVPTLQRFYS